MEKLPKAVICYDKRIGPPMLYVFAFLGLSSGITYWVFLKILKSCATLTFQVKVRHLRMDDDITLETIELVLV